MQTQPDSITEPKPRNYVIRPEITRLPRRTVWRRWFRWLVVGVLRLIGWLLTQTQTQGLENIPLKGPVLVVSNHLGDADLVLGMAISPRVVETLAKAELYDYPILGKLLDAYGVIWVHRGQPDRRALRAAMEALHEGRMVAIAPEGRESVTGALEEGTGGAAFLAVKSGVPILPVTFTGSENSRVYRNLKRLHRTVITITIGPAFHLDGMPDRREAIEAGTRKIMHILASQLPPDYRGVYSE